MHPTPIWSIGVDEVGRGPWAGPVCAAAVVLDATQPIQGLADSKRLSAKKRAELSPVICSQSLGWGLGWAHADEVDALNILMASLWAMQRAVTACLERLGSSVESSHVLVRVDGNISPVKYLGASQWPWPTQTIVGGDRLIAEISAASIVAKVARDTEMQRLDQVYPGYGFRQHAGYGTAQHQAALALLGPSAVHRKSFAPVMKCLNLAS